MADMEIEFSGFDELGAWIENFPRETMPIVVKHMDAAAGIVEGIIKEYPPADAANAPGRKDADGRPMGYYERGRGWWYPVQQAKTFHGVKGKSKGVIMLGKKKSAAMGALGYKLSARSETLGRRWTHTVVSSPGEVVGLIGNSASYASLVNGPDQTKLMQARGWKDPDMALDEATPAVNAEFGGMLDEIASKFTEGK